MRKYRDTPAPQGITRQQKNDTITQVRSYSLITPMFGGGTEPGMCDPITVIRGSEIRGQLRFWWRACRGGKYSTWQEMKEVEDEIWGKASKKEQKQGEKDREKDNSEKDDETEKYKGSVQIVIDVPKGSEGEPLKPYHLKWDERKQEYKVLAVRGVPAYAAFPLQPEKKERKDKNFQLKPLRQNVSFTLTITFPTSKLTKKHGKIEMRPEIEAALWAWETFGGIGARTRRGFGALRCESVKEGDVIQSPDLPLAEPRQTLTWLQEKLECHVGQATQWPLDVTHLPPSLIEKKTCKIVRPGKDASNPMSIWEDLIRRLYRFRQMDRFSSNRRSLWPEADTIRFLTNQSLKHKGREPVPRPSIDKFPRAAFGLPIIFQFIGNKDNDNNPNSCNRFGDPRKTVLREKDFERLASPLILKPLACQSNNCIGLAVILACTRSKPQQLELKTQQGREGSWEVQAIFDKDEKLPLQEQNGWFRAQITNNTEVLQVFLQYL
jgi:CRISPR-associated protein Cmr1